MWIVDLALRRPYTFIVVALLVLIIGPLSVLSMPTDIFPNINIPVAGRRLDASVRLIKALGGSWHAVDGTGGKVG